jgi:hypothetical protein
MDGDGHHQEEVICPFRVLLSYATSAYLNIFRTFSNLTVQIEMALPYGLMIDMRPGRLAAQPASAWYGVGLIFAVMPGEFWADFHRLVALTPKARVIVTTQSSAPQIPSAVAEEVRLC